MSTLSKNVCKAALATAIAGLACSVSAFGDVRELRTSRWVDAPAPEALPAPGVTPEQAQAARALIEAQVFGALVPSDQQAVIAAGLYTPPAMQAGSGSDADALLERPNYERLPALGEKDYRIVRGIIAKDDFLKLKPVHQHALVQLMLDQADGKPLRAMCFAPGTDPTLQAAFNNAVWGRFGDRARPSSRWSSTASGSSPNRGDRVTLTYSFVPDGTRVPTLNSANADSALFAFLNGIYGSPTVWQPIYDGIFARWSAVCGITYVRELNDDGVPVRNEDATFPATNVGVLGVRGDLRLGGAPLDGNSNVLAFNYFPGGSPGGDMVIDTSDNFYSNTTSNSLRFRNVLTHEHGHGLGLSHVCPVNQTKLMEPFVSVAFDGPQFDDVLGAQRNYGDTSEPNESVGTATPITNLAVNTTNIRPQLSLDGTSDTDFYSFNVTANGALVVTARPTSATYLEGPQNSDGSCSAGTNFDPRTANSMTVNILSSTGTLLATSGSVTLGSPVSASLQITTPGTYLARIVPGATDAAQAYQLEYRLDQSASVTVSLPQGAPTLLSPSGPTNFQVRIVLLNDTLVAGSAQVFYRFSPSAAYTAAALVPTTGDIYTATIPAAPCGSSPQFYVQARGTAAGLSSFPTGGASTPLVATPGANIDNFADNFEIDRGWSYGVAGDTATTGQWLRGTPIGTTAQPSGGFNSTTCAFTGQGTVGGAVGEADVDSGFTTLLSPRFSLLGGTNPTIRYVRWFSNNAGANPNTKVMRVDVSSDDGVTWTNLETVGPAGTSATWVPVTLSLPASVTPTANMRVRFVPDDTGTGSIVEAAVDDFSASVFQCINPCRADFDNNGTVEVPDIFAFLSAWFGNQSSADIDGNNLVEVADIFAYLSRYFAGC